MGTPVKLVIVVATLVLAWRLLQEIGWSELQQRVASAEPPLLLAASLLLVSRGVLLYLRWAQCLPLLGQAFSGSYVLVTHLAAILVNHLTPTARLLGGVMRARYFSRRYPVPFTDAYGTVLLDQTSHQIVQGLLTWLALAGLAWVANAKPIAIALLTGLPTLLFAMLVLAAESQIPDRFSSSPVGPAGHRPARPEDLGPW